MAPRKPRTPDQESPETPVVYTDAPAAESATAVAEPPASDTNGTGQGFADKVEPKKWTPAPDPFGIASDYVAGVRLFESKQDRQMAIKFGDGSIDDKPSQAVIDTMKEAGYRWNPSERIWAHPVRFDSALTTRIDAERLYQKIREMIRQEKGIELEHGVPF